MTKTYRFSNRTKSSWLTVLFGLIGFIILILGIVDRISRGLVWITAGAVFVICVTEIIKRISATRSYLEITGNQLVYYLNDSRRWTINIQQISEIDDEQDQARSIGWGLLDLFRLRVSTGRVGFTLLADNKEYVIEHTLLVQDYQMLLNDLSIINPAIQKTKLSQKLEQQFGRQNMHDYFQKKYGDSVIFKPIIWFSKQNVIVAAIIVIILSVLVIFFIPYWLSK